MKITRATFFSKRWGWLTLWVLCSLVLLLLSTIVSAANLLPWPDVSKDRLAWYHQEACEIVGTSSYLLQFHNVWSNLAYLAAGLLIVWLSTIGVGRAIGVVLIALAAGSAWFHGSLTQYGQISDVMCVYCALTALIAFGFIEMVPFEKEGYAAHLLFAAAILLGLSAGLLRHRLWFFNSDYFLPVLAGLLVFCMVMPAFRGEKGKEPLWWPAISSAASGSLALIFNFTDGDKNLLAPYAGDYSKCIYSPTGWIQGHALWHVFTAVMFVCIFEYFRSVRGRSQSVWPWRVPDS